MALERWLAEKGAGNPIGAELVRLVIKHFGDVPLTDSSAETTQGVKRFTPEAREALEKKGYVVFELKGRSIRELRGEGRPFSSPWHNSRPIFEGLSVPAQEVAINPLSLFLAGSNRKTLEEQEDMVREFSDQLSQEIKGVTAVIGEASQYAELVFMHRAQLDKKGHENVLYGKKYKFAHARTKTVVSGSLLATVGGFAKKGLHIGLRPVRDRNDRLWVSPLIIPTPG